MWLGILKLCTTTLLEGNRPSCCVRARGPVTPRPVGPWGRRDTGQRARPRYDEHCRDISILHRYDNKSFCEERSYRNPVRNAQWPNSECVMGLRRPNDLKRDVKHRDHSLVVQAVSCPERPSADASSIGCTREATGAVGAAPGPPIGEEGSRCV